MNIAQLPDLADPAKASSLVIKVGSALLVGSDGKARREWVASLASEIAGARSRGQQVVVVSSGAIAMGAARLNLPEGGRGSLADAQAAAAVGQIALAELWSELLGKEGLVAAQLRRSRNCPKCERQVFADCAFVPLGRACTMWLAG